MLWRWKVGAILLGGGMLAASILPVAAASVPVSAVSWCRSCGGGAWLNHQDDLLITVRSQQAKPLPLVVVAKVRGPGIKAAITFSERTLPGFGHITEVWALSPQGERYRVTLTLYRGYGSALVELTTLNRSVSTGEPWMGARNLIWGLVGLAVGTALLLGWVVGRLQRSAGVILTWFSFLGVLMGVYLVHYRLTLSVLALLGVFALATLISGWQTVRFGSNSRERSTTWVRYRIESLARGRGKIKG